MRDSDALAQAGADFIARFGCPDVVIANAGISRGFLTELPEDLPALRAIFETNVYGIVHTFQPFVAAMAERRSGALVGIASVAGFRGMPGSGAYCGSKSAAITYLESLRVEMRPRGVDVVTICPGFIETELTAKNPVLPWPMALVGRVLRILPRPLFDRIVQNRKRKPRDNRI